MDNIWNYSAPLTDHPIHICTTPNHAKEYLPSEVDLDIRVGACIEHLRTDGVFEIWIILNNHDPIVCCHESVHAAIGILNRAGIGFSHEEQETLAYMTDTIFNMTRDAVFKHYERLGKKA